MLIECILNLMINYDLIENHLKEIPLFLLIYYLNFRKLFFIWNLIKISNKNNNIRKLLFDAKKTLSQYEVESINLLKFGLIAYRDHDQENESYVSKILCELTGDKNKFREQLYNLDCKGGKDECEAILDGLDDAVNKMNWRNKNMKFIYHICGSPPHGEDMNCGAEDDYTDGCPCGKKCKNVFEDLRGKGIDYTVIGLDDDSLNNMLETFSKHCKIDSMSSKILKEDNIDDSQ